MKIPIVIALIGLVFSSQAQSSDDNSKLNEALKHFPEADASRDGVLTLEEARAFQQRGDKPDPKKDRGGGIKNSYIYKTVGKKELKLFVDVPLGHTADTKVAAIVFFHGGGFKSGSEEQFERQAAYLASRGMVAVRVRYRLTKEPGVKIEDCVEDAISSMRWVRANAVKLGVDPDRIASGGGSAGGYLSVATLMIDYINAKTDPADVSAKPNAMVLFNPGIRGEKKEDGIPDPRDPEGKGDLKKYVKPGQPPTITREQGEDITKH